MTQILTDSFGREHQYLRISLTEKCNLRCTYCMPSDGVVLSPKDHLMTADEVITLAKLFVENGVNKIRLTGGEPLLRKDFDDILLRLSDLDIELSLTTNGILVDRHLETFKASNIDTVNLSLDTLRPEKFKLITLRDQFKKASENIDLLLNEGFNVKINVVLISGFNDDEIIDFINLTCERNIQVRFIEFMPFLGNRWDRSKLVSEQFILDEVYAAFSNSTRLPEPRNLISRDYKIDGYLGSFGIISTMTNPFCDGCNRIRLTANGKLKNCLFSQSETDLLTPYRNGEDILPVIQKAIWAKRAKRAGMDTFETMTDPKYFEQNRSMITIGG
ncbi:GTP 3',8-cyclase MoaA [Aegicerativicinus sediminis]|uniref:GTP 3',8-cyclase MoaA n=1 Tax=Aegicerativicinus sediminis TaxID=2893202 RepID=UPI001E5787D7|nr:GTP 3',8-cyclase MoaA [Aegicerativicinus sediminis]